MYVIYEQWIRWFDHLSMFNNRLKALTIWIITTKKLYQNSKHQTDCLLEMMPTRHSFCLQCVLTQMFKPTGKSTSTLIIIFFLLSIFLPLWSMWSMYGQINNKVLGYTEYSAVPSLFTGIFFWSFSALDSLASVPRQDCQSGIQLTLRVIFV